MPNKQQISNGLLFTLIFFENLFLYVFFKYDILSTGKNAIGLFISSFLFGFVLVYKFYNVTIQEPASRPVKNNTLSYAMILLLIAGLVFSGIQYDTFIRSRLITYTTSDIIPVIQIMCKRAVNGLTPYYVFNDFGYPMQTGYLPMHWLPFTIAEILHIDYRWITYGMWCIVSIWLCIRTTRIQSKTLRIIAPVLIYGSYYIMFSNANIIVEATVELLISGYYMMLMISLNQNNGILQGVFFSCCLLSRYSVVLWIPLFCFVLYITQNKKQLYTAATTAIIIVTCLYIIPFLSKDWGMLSNSYKGYDAAAYGEWRHMNKIGQPMHLFKGTGFAYYFYTRFTNLDIMSRIKLLQRTQLVCSLLTTILMGIWFWYKKEKINHKIFLLSSFKIYFAVFLFLIQVPYGYLMCVGNFVSIAIFCEQARYRITERK